MEKNKGEDEGGGRGGGGDEDEDEDEEEEEEKEGRKEGRKERAKGPHRPHAAGAKKRANLLNLWEHMNSGQYLLPL